MVALGANGDTVTQADGLGDESAQYLKNFKTGFSILVITAKRLQECKSSWPEMYIRKLS
jgi:hypothetical protein